MCCLRFRITSKNFLYEVRGGQLFHIFEHEEEKLLFKKLDTFLYLTYVLKEGHIVWK